MYTLMSRHRATHARRGRSDQGMTLLELIVVIVILGILAAIAIPTFLKVIQNSKDGAATETANSLSHEATALAAFTGNGAASLDANGNSYVYNAARADLTSYNFHNAVTGATNDTDYTASGTAKGTITEVTSTTWNISVGDPGESCLTASTAVDVVGTASAGACSDYVAPGSGSTTTSSSTTTTTTPVALTRGTLTSDGFAAVCNVTYQVALGSDDGVGAGIEAARGFGSAMAGQDSDLEFYSAQFYCNTNAGTSSAAAVYRTSTDSPPSGGTVTGYADGHVVGSEGSFSGSAGLVGLCTDPAQDGTVTGFGAVLNGGGYDCGPMLCSFTGGSCDVATVSVSSSAPVEPSVYWESQDVPG